MCIYTARDFEVALNRALTLVRLVSNLKSNTSPEMPVSSSLFDVLPYVLSALCIFFHTILCYPLKRELQFEELFFFSGLRKGLLEKH